MKGSRQLLSYKLYHFKRLQGDLIAGEWL